MLTVLIERQYRVQWHTHKLIGSHCGVGLMLPVVAICHKPWGGPGLKPPLTLRQSSFLPFRLVDSRGDLVRACCQSNSLIKSTLMFRILPGTEISVHAEFSHCRQHWYYGLQAMYSSMALKCRGSVHIWTPTARRSGSGPPQDRHHWLLRLAYPVNICNVCIYISPVSYTHLTLPTNREV